MIRTPPVSTLTCTLFPYTSLFRSYTGDGAWPTNTGFGFAGQLGIHPLDAAACFQRSTLLLDSPQKIRLGDPEYGALLTIILGAGDRLHADDRHCHDGRKSHAVYSSEIGRASLRERVCQDVWCVVGYGSVKKK